MADIQSFSNLIWSTADLLRGTYKQADYGKVILPLTVLRRLDQVLEPTRETVRAKAAELEARGIQNVGPALERAAGGRFYNTSRHSFSSLRDDPASLGPNLRSYIGGFSQTAREALDHFGFEQQIDRLEKANLLYQVVGRFADVDLHPERISNLEMGYLFEELIRKFAEQSNETAGEHFTPREVIRLMVNILLIEDENTLRTPGIVKSIYDCACGTGGMLSEADRHVKEHNPDATLLVYGQELNPESYAICLSDMLVKGYRAELVAFGNSFTEDGHRGERFDYLIANPPFGVDWKGYQREVVDEHQRLGFDGRFGPGLPRVSDGSLLFLMHLVSKMKRPEEGGSRLAIVFNGSPLFTGAAGGGESEIRRWLIENDMLEAVVGLPDQLFYNTGISTYFWIVTNRKSAERQGKVQLIDARESFVKMRKGLGDKRKAFSDEQIAEITRLYGAFEESNRVKIVRNEELGFRRIQVERPLRLRWRVASEKVDVVAEAKAVAKLPDDERAALVARLAGVEPLDTLDRAVAERHVAAALDGRPATPLLKALLDAYAERDPNAPVQTDAKSRPLADPELRDAESVPLDEDLDAYIAREVLPFAPDAWVEPAGEKVGYEIPFTRLFYRYTPPRSTEVIKAEIRAAEEQIRALVDEMLA